MLKQYREANGIGRVEMASRLGVTQARVTQIELNYNHPRAGKLAAYCRAAGEGFRDWLDAAGWRLPARPLKSGDGKKRQEV